MKATGTMKITAATTGKARLSVMACWYWEVSRRWPGLRSHAPGGQGEFSDWKVGFCERSHLSSDNRIPDHLQRGIPAMKSKLLQKISYGLDRSRESVGGQQEDINDSVNPTDDAQAQKDFPSLLKPKTQFVNCQHNGLRST
jgi:hypothetical protein